MKSKKFCFTFFLLSVFSLYTIAQTYQGVGARITTDPDGNVIILEVFPGSPAEQQGLQSGDRITSIEGVSTQDLSLEESVQQLQGQPGTKIKIEVEDRGSIDIERAEIQTPEPDQRRRRRERPDRPEPQSPATQEGIILMMELAGVVCLDGIYQVNLNLGAYNPRYSFIQEGDIFIRIPSGLHLDHYRTLSYPLHISQQENILHITFERPFQIQHAKEILVELILTGRTLPHTFQAEFLFEEDCFTSLKSSAGTSILGTRINPKDGVIQLRASTGQYTIDSGDDIYVPLVLELPGTIALNQPVMGHLILQNPAHVTYNHIDIVLSYEGAKIEFDDLDDGNHISMGLNVWDGPYKDSFSFSEHYRNTIDTRRQRIQYRKGSARGIQSEGTLFSFQFTPRARGKITFQVDKDSTISLNQKRYSIEHNPLHITVR